MGAYGDHAATGLDPVLEQALSDLRSFTYRRRRLIVNVPGASRRERRSSAGRVLCVIRYLADVRREDRDKSLNDPGARSGAIHIFKHLRHHGYDWEPEAVRGWAVANGFRAGDARLLAEYAADVKSGVRYHTTPDPFGQHAIVYWRQRAGMTDSRVTG